MHAGRCPADVLARPVSAKKELPTAPDKLQQLGNQQLQCDLRKLTSCAL